MASPGESRRSPGPAGCARQGTAPRSAPFTQLPTVFVGTFSGSSPAQNGNGDQIRVMFKHFGRLVEKLRRVKIGFLELDLPPGRYRVLTPREIDRFRKILKLDAPEKAAAGE